MLKKSFNLDHNFYNAEYIHLAIEDFWEDFSLSYQNNILDITAESDEVIDEVFREFMNYVIGLHNELI